MKPLVLDASVTLAGHLRDENSGAARELFTSLNSWETHAPAIWPLEVTNGLVVACRRGRISTADADMILRSLGAYRFQIHGPAAFDGCQHLLSLANRYGLTAYDAVYLQLAVKLNAAMATLDVKLAQAAQAAGLSLAIERAG